MRRLLMFAALLFAFPAQATVAIDWVTVGDPGNACETQSQGCFGAVAYTYKISKYEVKNAQYAEFLNAVAATDTYGLYNPEMSSSTHGGITQSGSPGSFTYAVKPDMGNKPVTFVSFYDALRFANWLHNGQPTGAQDSTTTEDGAYTFSGLYTVGARNADAVVFLTSEDEWYKAAYYKGGGTSAGYWDYPAGSSTQTSCTTPGATPNAANCNASVGTVTDVGAYTGAASPSGTFDQGGNVREWNEAIINVSRRAYRGASQRDLASALAASIRNDLNPGVDGLDLGFRVARPLFPGGIPALSPIALLLTAAGLLGFGAYRRGRA